MNVTITIFKDVGEGDPKDQQEDRLENNGRGKLF
jgi:hypothetical protein